MHQIVMRQDKVNNEQLLQVLELIKFTAGLPTSQNASSIELVKFTAGLQTSQNASSILRCRPKLTNGCTQDGRGGKAFLFEMLRYLHRLSVAPWPPLSLTHAEHGHAVLAVDKHAVLDGV